MFSRPLADEEAPRSDSQPKTNNEQPIDMVFPVAQPMGKTVLD
jgi:hypothetical protein